MNRKVIPKAHAGTGPARARRKFLRYFKKGFADETYFDWERGYKEHAHQQWLDLLSRETFKKLLDQPAEIAARAVRSESRTNLLFSFEKMALRDALKSPEGAEIFAHGLCDFLHGRGSEETRFESGAPPSPGSRAARPASSPGHL